MDFYPDETPRYCFSADSFLTGSRGDMQCRRLSPGEIRYAAGKTTGLSRYNGSKMTQYIFRKHVPEFNLNAIHPAMYKKLSAFFNWTEMLDCYDNVYILANSTGGWYEKLHIKENDLVIVFNHYSEALVNKDECDVVILHRQIDDIILYHGFHRDFSARRHNVIYGIILTHAAMLNTDSHIFPRHQMALPADLVPYSINTTKMASSGFVLLSVLYYIWRKKAFLRKIKPVGFQFSDSGWSGHDWEYERFQASQMAFGRL